MCSTPLDNRASCNANINNIILFTYALLPVLLLGAQEIERVVESLANAASACLEGSTKSGKKSGTTKAIKKFSSGPTSSASEASIQQRKTRVSHIEDNCVYLYLYLYIFIYICVFVNFLSAYQLTTFFLTRGSYCYLIVTSMYLWNGCCFTLLHHVTIYFWDGLFKRCFNRNFLHNSFCI